LKIGVFEKTREAAGSFTKFFAIVGAHDALAGGKRQRLEHAGKLYA